MTENEKIISSVDRDIEFKEKRIKALVDVLLRQTDMKYEEAEESLKNNDYDLMKTLRQYMNPNTDQKENNTSNKSINQMIYKEIRQTMDKASLNFLRKQEYQRQLESRRQILLERYREQLERERNINNQELTTTTNESKMDKLD